ncbi:hypothetical protein M422DRAFT_259386 [Sphaerobolus stellatus SS14]|uniref:Uncharacterized protein n=1 Tax=Sphaerobolus stellatus (strain SS14) TaxID=990650 RepID=A0A0C9VJY5_SPHS4|nr:hypothetical protein M422DRAFT_259386 [Sphaerobolus stellatus SS14]
MHASAFLSICLPHRSTYLPRPPVATVMAAAISSRRGLCVFPSINRTSSRHWFIRYHLLDTTSPGNRMSHRSTRIPTQSTRPAPVPSETNPPTTDTSIMLQHGLVFTSIQGAVLPPMPSEQPDTIIHTLLPLELVDRHWLSEAHPYLAPALLQPTFTGVCFNGWRSALGRYPLDSNGSVWGLHPGVIETWAHLENALYFISKRLLSKTNVNLPVDFAFTRLPHTYGYCKKFLSSKRAKSAVLRSQQAFMPLMAMVSFAIAIYPDGEDGTAQPAWYTSSRHMGHRLHATNPRVGAFVDMRKLTSANVLKELHRAGAPLWFCWGPPDTRAPPPQ